MSRPQQRTAWHPLLVLILKALLPRRDQLRSELPLTQEHQLFGYAHQYIQLDTRKIPRSALHLMTISDRIGRAFKDSSPQRSA